MKDFAKSIVCNTKAEAEKVGNFEDPKKAKHYIEMWERRRDDAKRSLQNAEGHLKEAMKHRYGDKEFNQREVQRYQEAVKAAEATIKQYDDLIKSAAKTSFGNTRTGNTNKAEIIEKKKKEGATLKVDNGQKLEFSDGSTYVKTSFSDDYREAHNYTGNKKLYWDVGNYDWDVGIFNGQWYITKNGQKFKGPFRSMNEAERYLEGHKWEFEGKLAKSKTGNSRTGNSYNWEERRGHQELYDPTFPFGGHVRGYVEKTKNGYVGAKTNGSILIAKKEFATEAEAKKFVENKHTGNKKVGNANTHLTASNSGELWLNFDGTGEMYDPIELGRYDFSGKSEALSVARELEQLKRKAEQKVKDADKFINAIKQWAAGLK